jgi:hypothetical protein
MKNYLYYLSFILFVSGSVFLSTGCASDPASIPSFVRIDTIIVDSTSYVNTGSNASKVNFAWVYMDGNLQGVYLLPCRFPVIGEGIKEFQIFAGVYDFGNQANATRYLFYDPWIFTDTLVIQDTLWLKPHVEYDTAAFFATKQDFDAGIGFTGSDFIQSTNTQGNYISSHSAGYEGLCGYMHMGSGDSTYMAIESGSAINVPKGKQGYYIEVNYKCNAPFYFNVITSTGSQNIIGFNTKTTWSKAYINITNAMDVIPGTDVKLVFVMYRDETIPDQEVFIDNVKLIHTLQ